MMDDPISIRTKAGDELNAQYSCNHEKSELRKRIVDKGGIQFVKQCVRCGSSTTSPIGTAKALAQNDGNEPPRFDEDLLDKWDRGLKEGWERINREYQENVKHYEAARKRRETEWWTLYKKYLKSPEWMAKREKIILRAQGVCEGCREAKAVHVHHLSYDHMGNEFLFELVAVCTPCHERLHSDEDTQTP
jgi:5-methylcytosine-specific restriction endonuclease McrA